MIENDHNIEILLRRPQQQVGVKNMDLDPQTVKSCPKLINHFLEYMDFSTSVERFVNLLVKNQKWPKV